MPKSGVATNSNSKPQSDSRSAKALLKWHRQHQGVYARVAKRLAVDPSFVSRVASGERQSAEIQQALVSELTRIQQRWPREIGQAQSS